eukprot:101614_1
MMTQQPTKFLHRQPSMDAKEELNLPVHKFQKIYRQQLVVFGYARAQEKSCPDDIMHLIYKFYLIMINSTILSSDEQVAILSIMYDQIKYVTQKKVIRSIDTRLLYRATENLFSIPKMHSLCDNKGPTIVVIENELNHVFGGYARKSWTSAARNGQTIKDPNSFLFMLRPTVKVCDAVNTEKAGILCRRLVGVSFGMQINEDIYMPSSTIAGEQEVISKATRYKIDSLDMTGGRYYVDVKYCKSKVQNYEVFNVCIG